MTVIEGVIHLLPRKGLPRTAVHRKGSAVDWLGFLSALAITVVGVAYVALLGALAVLGQLVMPPTQPVQLFGGIVTIIAAPLLVILMACVHETSPRTLHVYSLSALVFTVLFAAMVSINRYVQLTVIRQGMTRGAVEELKIFLPYGSDSVMFSLEILGWGFFMGIAALCAAPLFTATTVDRWLRGLFITYGALGLTSALGLVLASPISAVGFMAWGPVLDAITGLLAVRFWRNMRTGGFER